MFQTKSIRYSLLSKDSLDLLLDYVKKTNSIVNQKKYYKGMEHRPVFLNGYTNWQGNSTSNLAFKPYINLLAPIKDKLENNNLRLVFVGFHKIDPNTPKRRSHAWRMLQSKKTKVNSIMLIPLEDYSRTEKIYSINNKLVALNSTVVVGPNEFNYFENPYNNTYCLIAFGLENTIGDIQNNLS